MSAAREIPRDRSGRAVLLARLGLVCERLAAVWMPLLLAVAAIAVLGLWGAFEILPPAVGAALAATGLAAAAAAAILNLVRLSWPSRTEARERLVIDYGGEPDELAAGDARLWARHLERVEAARAAARAGRMGAGIAAADPMALRYALAVAAALALWAFGPATGARRVAQAFAPVSQVGGEARVLLARAGLAAGEGLHVAGLMLEGIGGSNGTFRPAQPRLERASIQSRAHTAGKPRILPAASSPYPTK